MTPFQQRLRLKARQIRADLAASEARSFLHDRRSPLPIGSSRPLWLPRSLSDRFDESFSATFAELRDQLGRGDANRLFLHRFDIGMR